MPVFVIGLIDIGPVVFARSSDRLRMNARINAGNQIKLPLQALHLPDAKAQKQCEKQRPRTAMKPRKKRDFFFCGVELACMGVVMIIPGDGENCCLKYSRCAL